jgi:RecG-like helicase
MTLFKLKKMENDNTFIQVWDYLIDNEELDCVDLILLSKIISLSTTKDGCYMSNSYICNLIRVKNEETASRRVTRLKKLGYINVDEKTKNNKSSRKIYPTYQNGLTLKSSRIDSKVKEVLTSKSSEVDSKVKEVLTSKSNYNNSDNINLTNQSHNTSSSIKPKKINDFNYKKDFGM